MEFGSVLRENIVSLHLSKAVGLPFGKAAVIKSERQRHGTVGSPAHHGTERL